MTFHLEIPLVRRTLTVALSLVVVAGVHSVTAQSPTPPQGAQVPAANGEVRGKVVDAKSDAAIARASVSLRPKGATAIVAGAIANADGAFRVQGLRPGVYTARITFIGFAPLTQDVTISNDAPVANVGVVKLSPVAVALSAVAVTEERATVTIEPDRNAYKAKDVAPSAGNASEVLDAVPSVQVDGDGKVSLRGNENVVVQINGRPTPIRGTQLAAYLKTLPANVIDRVEVIPNPSAKYDPEGMAGIINIQLKQNVDLGVSGGLNLGFSNADRYNGSTNLGYQSGPFTTFMNVGAMTDRRSVVGINARERYDAVRNLMSVTDQDIASAASNGGQNVNATVDYKLTSRDVLSQALAFNHRSGTDASVSAYSELNGAGALLDRYDRPRNSEVSGWMVDYDVSLKRTFEPRRHEWSGEVRFNRAHDQDFSSFWRQAPGVSAVPHLEGEDNDNDALTKTFTAQTDYVRTLAPRTKLETGYKGNARWLDREFLVRKDSLGTGNWTRSRLSNDFAFDENVQAAYAVLSQGVRKFDLQAGLRAEYASRTFNLSNGADRYPYAYKSLFPSGVVMYNKSDAVQMKASYSRRIRRPGTQELNPFPQFFDVQNLFIGNPNLSPEYTDAIELGLTRNMPKGTVQVSPFYRHTSNIIRVDINPTDVIEGREVTSISFRNLATSSSWGADMNGSVRLGPKFNGFGGFNVFKMVTDGGSTSAVGSDAVTWMARVNGTSELTKTLMLQASYMYRAPMKIERGRFEAQQMTNVAIRKKLKGDQASVTLRVNDPFNTGMLRVRAGDDKVIQVTERNFGSRMAFLAFQYNYGRPPRVRQVQQEQGAQGAGFPPPG